MVWHNFPIMNLAKTNQAILLAIRTSGTRRAADESYFEATVAQLVEATGFDEDLLTDHLEALCVSDQYSAAPLVKTGEGVYGQRMVLYGFDYHEVRENDDHGFDVARGDGVISTHETKGKACEAADDADHAHVMRHARPSRPVDQRHYDTRVSRCGEPTCMPDRW